MIDSSVLSNHPGAGAGARCLRIVFSLLIHLLHCVLFQLLLGVFKLFDQTSFLGAQASDLSPDMLSIFREISILALHTFLQPTAL